VNEYEIMLMLDPELPEERGSEIIERMRAEIEKGGGTWEGHEPWGRRKLAYEIAHKSEGIYHLLLFTASPDALAEVSRVLKITDGVMRHMAVKRIKPSRREPVAAGPPAVEATE
jgi:small subunit ribosomal protein S6